jgi:hypothetical protein
MRTVATLVAVAVVALAAGCGGDGDGESSAIGDQIHSALELKTRSGSSALYFEYTTGKGCQVGAILTTADQVEQYEGRGDTVATNPDGTAGVVFSASPDGGSLDDCVSPAEEDLVSVTGD